jgi:hypothetical protein
LTNWIKYEEIHPDFFNIKRAVVEIANSFENLNEYWKNYLKLEYSDYENERNDYMDMSAISGHLISLMQKNDTSDFMMFFASVEKVLNKCDTDTEELIVTGLLESIQNNAIDNKIDISDSFDIWLQQTTKKRWNELIDFWDGKQQKTTGNNV